MAKYRVKLSRVVEQEAQFYVDAKTPAQAKALAGADKDVIWYDVSATDTDAVAWLSEEVDGR